ncbi:MAG: hypothetical protein K2F74_03915, partial [Muribaculaceae bacterium]|nr:hypothetical protein [Muribaculaceae bacterium]
MISADGAICDLSGKNVDVFIDHLPASQDDMKAMRMQDVKKVEYYDFPSDPRFQGKAHVVNFVMQKYEYGGYIKAYGWENTGNAGQASLYSKLQYKRMTFDLATGYFYLNQKHSGADSYEVFRLPQADGTTEVFERNSIQTNGRQRQNLYWPTFKALYSSDRITIQNTLGASFDHTPANSSAGYVEYIPAVSGRIDYSQNSSSRVNSLSYNGYWHFILNDKNSITFSPRYAYSHTNTNSLYSEADAAEFYNAARDNSHQFNGTLTYSHTFGKWGTLNTMLQSAITSNRTSYSGTATTSDNARTCRIGPGVRYSLSKEKFYGLAGFGYQWDRQEYIDYKDDTAAPWIDLSLQYSPNYLHSLRGEFQYSTWNPSSNLRSSAVIQSNPLMSYTGNPGL